ncbi:MAG: four-helix bundle copper-binding protein [Isosphaeraceae bacterium]
MDRRELLGVLGTAAAGLVAVTERAAAAIQEGHRHSAVHEDCLRACQECSRSCNETFQHCYERVAEGKKEHAKALHLVADCAKFCNLSSDLMANGSSLMIFSCAACAEACKACAAQCDKFHEAEMQDCARACQTCEKTCLAMVREMRGH